MADLIATNNCAGTISSRFGRMWRAMSNPADTRAALASGAMHVNHQTLAFLNLLKGHRISDPYTVAITRGVAPNEGSGSTQGDVI